MAFDGRVFRILIASPSDVEEEREIAVRVIQEWNDLYAFSRKTILLPLRWETHTAPEYGTRPQEVINKAIVDQCDLLVGIFWTRIGSPTGKADSGTLEEIERVGKAEKPIMLYFSSVGIDPNKIDTAQMDKLALFKTMTYPNGLVEGYKSFIEFKDKFARQLEFKVRDLQKSENTGVLPVTLNFLSLEEGKLLGDKHAVTVTRPVVDNFDEVPENKRALVKSLVANKIDRATTIPIMLAIDNSGSSGIRNLYIELYMSSSVKNSALTVEKPAWQYTSVKFTEPWTLHYDGEDLSEPKYARFESDELIETDNGWRLSFDWEAIQPQRTRLIKPILYFRTSESTNLSIEAKVFADSFPEPVLLHAELAVTINNTTTALNELSPDWADRIKGTITLTTGMRSS